MPFCHLHVHSHYSLLDGMSRVPALVDKCLSNDMHAMALTDHGVMYGIKEFFDYCKDKDFTPIAGVEAYCARREQRSHDKDFRTRGANGKDLIVDLSGWHLILLAKNLQGYHNLCKLVSASFTDDGFYGKPRIDKELLKRYHEGLICSSACLAGEINQKLLLNDYAGAKASVEWFHDLFGEDYYLEVQRHPTDKPGADKTTYLRQQTVGPQIMRLGTECGVKVIATNDAHFVNEEDGVAHDRLICVSTNALVNDLERMHYTQQEWLKSPQEMENLFPDAPDVLLNTMEVAGKVEKYSLDSKPLLPQFPIPEGFNDEGDYLAHLVHQGAIERYGDPIPPEVQERIDYELGVMNSMGFPGYFLIVWDFIRAAREELDVLTGPGRGSAAGSVVAYCLHITDLDPLKYGLLFERFLNPDRVSLPDIDTDFDDEGRTRVLEYVSQKYGADHVAHVDMFGVMSNRTALQDLGRIYDISLNVTNGLKKYIPAMSFPDAPQYFAPDGKKLPPTLPNCYKLIPDFARAINDGDATVKEMFKYACALEDTNRTVGVHPCAVVIAPDDVSNFVPVGSIEDKKSGERTPITQYDGHYIESVGLIKMDFLGLKTLSILKKCLHLIQEVRGETIDLARIPLDDKATYKIFCDGNTTGLFQFESGGMRRYLRALQPSCLDDLIAMNALYRPGPMENIPSFIRRKQGKEPITYDLPCMEQVLKSTYGITVYQEQVMQLSRVLADFTRGQADTVRKAMGKKKKKLLDELQVNFLQGGVAKHYPETTLRNIWSHWEKFASYAFNKSHAACYAYLAYQTAYLKAHYAAEFMAASLTVAGKVQSKVMTLMGECKTLGVKVLPPSVLHSQEGFTVDQQGAIRFGLGGIKGLGAKVIETLLADRTKQGAYKDVFDFVERVPEICNKKSLESLAYSGAFDEILGSYSRETIAMNTDALCTYGAGYKQLAAESVNSLFGDMGTSHIARPLLAKAPMLLPKERLRKEYDLVGMYLSSHPLDEYIFAAETFADLDANNLQYFLSWRSAGDRAEREEDDDMPSPEEWLEQYGKRPVRCVVFVSSAELLTAKSGRQYGKYTFVDYSGTASMTLFGEQFNALRNAFTPDSALLLEGTIDPRGAGKWYTDRPFNETDYEFNIKTITPLIEVYQRFHSVQLRVKSRMVDATFVEGLKSFVRTAPDDAFCVPVNVFVGDEDLSITLTTSSKTFLHLDRQCYLWLQERKVRWEIK